MIRNNRKRPGTIQTTPAIRRHPRSNYQTNQNDDIYTQQPGKWSTQPGSIKNNQQFYSQERQRLEFQDQLEVNMSGIGFDNLEKQIDRHLKLESVLILNLSFNALQSFPASIFNRLTTMTDLNLQNNCLDKISFPYFKNPTLITVNISSNHLISLNLQHLSAMTQLNCNRNNLTFLTLPSSLHKINCSKNKLSNLYFLQHCYLLQQILIRDNLLYDIKFSFKSTTKYTEDQGHQNQIRFKCLKVLDCGYNKIEYFQGMINIVNLKILKLNDNKIAFTRDMINELLILQSLEMLEIGQNPVDQGGFCQEQVYSMFSQRLPQLKVLNGYSPDIFIKPEGEKNWEGSQSKRSQFSGIMDQPYQLFMNQEQVKKETGKPMEWNFTLGDCQPNEEPPINDLSLIQELQHPKIDEKHDNKIPKMQGVNQHIFIKDQKVQVQQEEEESCLRDMLRQQQDRQVRLKVVKSVSSLSMPHHIHYQPYLKALLPISYIPTYKIPLNASPITSRRLQTDDDDYHLLSKMFLNRGGIVYIKKITNWLTHQNQQQIFNSYQAPSCTPSMGFLLNEIPQKQFRQLCKYNKLVPHGKRDIIGLQPNVFSCFHIIVRANPYCQEQNYNCAYLVQTCHL